MIEFNKKEKKKKRNQEVEYSLFSYYVFILLGYFIFIF